MIYSRDVRCMEYHLFMPKFLKLKEGDVMTDRRFSCCILLLFFLFTSLAIADDFTLEDVPEEFIGTYIPVQYDNILRTTRSHCEAMHSCRDQYHDILLLNENICYSNAGFHDGYAIRREKFKDFRFVENANGKFIVDDNGNSYRKISDNVGASGYDDFEAYVLSIIFEDAQYLKNVSLESNQLRINNVEFTAILDMNFFETEGVSLWLFGNGEQHALKIEGISAKIFESDYERVFRSVSDRCFMEFPMFYWGDKIYPEINLWNLSNVDLRYLRNLIYAKHGYVFKSQDLQDLYENFSWYKQNLSFSENEFSRKEKQLLDRIIRYEE